MATCDYCGEEASHLLKCSQCDRRHCIDHQLPESHDCVLNSHQTERVFESDAPSIRERGTGRSRKVGPQPEDEPEDSSPPECRQCGRRIAPTERLCAACRPSTPTPEHYQTDSPARTEGGGESAGQDPGVVRRLLARLRRLL